MRGLALLALVAGCDRLFAIDELVVPDAPLPPPDAPPVAPSLVAWYPMDEDGDSTKVPDRSGHEHHGTCALPGCPTPTTDPRSALVFDGVDDIVLVTATPKLNATAAFTVAFWLRFDARPVTNYSCPASKGIGTSGDNSWQVCLTPEGHLAFISSGLFLSDMPMFAVGAWHHIAIQWTGAFVSLWIDGAAVTSMQWPAITFDDGSVRLGADLDDGSVVGPFAGALDDVRIYDRAITDAELAALAQPGS